MTGRTCYCGSAAADLYAGGWRCASHTPAAIAGRPEPGAERYCAPLRCYCGNCPGYEDQVTYADDLQRTTTDARAIASGRRRSSLSAYRAAQAAIQAQKKRPA